MKSLYFYTNDMFTISGLLHQVSQFSIHNGCLPQVIYMNLDIISQLKRCLVKPNIKKLTILDIPIKEIKVSK